MADINPYAPVVIDSASIGQPSFHERVYFAGTLTEADCQTVLRDHVPTGNPVVAWLRFGILILLLVSVEWLVGISATIVPILWMLGAIAISPIWMRLLASFWYRGARSRYAEALHANAKPTSGWCDKDGLVKFDEGSAIRATWQHFDRAFLFERAINILVQADVRLRVVLPWHFFASADEYAAARALLADELPDAGAKQAQDAVTVPPELSFDGEPRHFAPDQVQQWNEQEWPFPSTANQQADFVLEPSRVVNALTTRLKVMGVATALVMSFAIPLLAGIGGYAILRYWTAGGWDYLWNDWFLQAIIVLPVTLFFAFLFVAMVSRIRTTREAQQRAIFVRLRDEGIYLRREGIEVWMKREEIVSTEVDEKQAGWAMPAQVEPVRFPRAMFADEEAFRAFGTQLARYQSANTTRPSATDSKATQS